MALNVPFSLPCALPIPRRFIQLGLVILCTFLILHTFAPTFLPPVFTPSYPHYDPDASILSGAKWLPPAFNSDRPPPAVEWDEDGLCRFVSPFAALSKDEQLIAESISFDHVSAGIVRARDDSDGSSQYSHPILGLIRDGERKWNDLLAGQSRTLEQAVKRYEERWGRPPPRGFDDWWHFALSREALLPDEFDGIMESFLPFYGLPIATLAQRGKELEEIVETFTLIVEDGNVMRQWNDDYTQHTWWASGRRADAQINLMEPFVGMLPNFRATYSIHDQPTILLDYKRHKELVDAALSRKVSTSPNEEDHHEMDWNKRCGPDSAMHKGIQDQPATDTFISGHVASMNPCDHPTLLEQHGMFLEKHTEQTKPTPHTKLYPMLVLSKTALNDDILVTPIGSDNGRDEVGEDPSWAKKSGKLYWRGLATGLSHDHGNGAKWRQSHRERLHFLTNSDSKNLTDVLAPIDRTGQAETLQVPLKDLGNYYTDTKLAGDAWQCNNDDGTCDEMRNEITFAPKDDPGRSNDFKYILDTDGNAWSSRFPRLMSSLNVVIKATVFPEWNSGHLPEWFAYVPTKVDYSDLYSILTFFRGRMNGKGGHDEVARRIALNGQCWVEKTWRKEDLQIYMFRLYLEYARLMSPDRDNGKMDFVLKDYQRDPKEGAAAGGGAVENLEKVEAMPGISE